MNKESLKSIMKRRDFIEKIAFTGASIILSSSSALKSSQHLSNKFMPLCLFSKHLQWLDYNEMAKATAKVGFDGVALTVRSGGHVLPNRAENDLPKAVEAVRKSGIEVYMMTTDITDPADPNTEKILRTASKLGIHYYRLGYMRYDQNKDIIEQLESYRPKLKVLAEMNAHYKIFGGNHNHTENYIGGSIWDTWELVKGLNTEWIGFQFDTGNAIREGAEGTWKTNARLAAPYTKMLAVKTYAEWENKEWKAGSQDRRGKFPMMTPDGFYWFFKMLKEQGFSGPLSVHYEFPGLGGAEKGAKKLQGISKETLFNIMHNNLNTLKNMINEAE